MLAASDDQKVAAAVLLATSNLQRANVVTGKADSLPPNPTNLPIPSPDLYLKCH